MTYIFWKNDADGLPTEAFNDDGEDLGHFSYERVGRFMQWKWYQHQDIGMTGGCIDEMREQQKKLWRIKNEKKQH